MEMIVMGGDLRDVAVAAVVPDHLFAPVRDVGTPRIKYGAGMAAGHSRAGKTLTDFPSPDRRPGGAGLGGINDRSLPIQVRHPFLREGRPDDVTGRIFHGRIVPG